MLGNNLVEGINFNETFAPVAHMARVRCILTIAISKGWGLHQMDIHNVFFHGDLDKDIYMKPPLGFSPLFSILVFKPRISFYGLRDTPRQWYFKLMTSLENYSFKQSPLDQSL